MNQAFQVAPQPLYSAEKPERIPAYRRLIKRFGCAVCRQKWGIDACHSGPHALSIKSSDLTCIALCRKHHQEMDRNPEVFARKYNLDIAGLIRRYLRAWNHQQQRSTAR